MRTTVTITLMGFVSSALMFVYIASKAAIEELEQPADSPDRLAKNSLTHHEHSLQA